MMMLNLFENFDPATSMNLSLNWISSLLFIILIPMTIWYTPSRSEIILITLMKTLFYEFKLLTTNKYKINIILFSSLLLIIMMSNIMSLFPYIFTSTSHMSFNLIMALPMWLSFMIYGWFIQPKNMLAHLVPLNTPVMLMNFMVLIELISNLIRPWTLSIRLTANMIAGHLLLTLIGTFMNNFISLIPLSFIIQNMLFILEISVSLIQSYVFTILMVLYFTESKI